MNRYAAKLLFQFRVMIAGVAAKRRMCEERTIVFDARSHRDAIAVAKRRGKKDNFSYKNSDGNPVFFEFVGLMDLMDLTYGPDEVWCDMNVRLLPMERREQILRSEQRILERMTGGHNLKGLPHVVSLDAAEHMVKVLRGKRRKLEQK